MSEYRILEGDCLDVLATLPERSVQTCITSPPYFGLRDYGTGTWTGGDSSATTCQDARGPDQSKVAAHDGDHATDVVVERGEQPSKAFTEPFAAACGKCGATRTDSQIGLEETPEQYVANLVAVFREVRRVLRDDGLADGGLYGSTVRRPQTQIPHDATREGYHREELNKQASAGFLTPALPKGCKPKDLLGIPWMVAFALRQPYYAGRIKDERDRIWLAAMVDAEGCIHIHRRPAGQNAHSSYVKKDGTRSEYVRKQDTYGVMVSIDNTSKAVIDRCAEIVGQGSRYTHEAGAGAQQRKQTIYRLTLTGQQSRDLLRELYPHLVAKQREARIAYASPSSGESGQAAHEAIKLLHNGSDTTVDYPAAPNPNPMPESVTDRPTKAHEYLFLLSKSARYFYDADAVREDAIHEGRIVKAYGDGAKNGDGATETNAAVRLPVSLSTTRRLTAATSAPSGPSQLSPSPAHTSPPSRRS
jgi:hypothetical protein